jgi:hypothetical protein
LTYEGRFSDAARAVRRRLALLLGSISSAAAALAPGTARALEPELTSDTAAQFYEMRSPTGQTIIARRRFTTTLGVAGYELLDKPADAKGLGGPSLVFKARMRYDADYGGGSAETDPANYGHVVPGFERGPIDLMYGYVEGRRFLKGWLGFRLGRQYVTDALGWWSFDGGLVRVTSPYYVAAEVYGGLEQRGGLPLSTSRYEADGVWRGNRKGYDPAEWPSFQPNAVAPAYGFALESTGVTWIHGRLTYRRVYNTGGSNVSEFANGLRAPVTYDGTRISSERVGYAVDASTAKVGGIKAGVAYDLYDKVVGNFFASVDGYVSQRLTLSVDYDYYRPTFDADSIWNFFLAMPMNDIGARAEWEVTDHVSLAGGAHARLFTLQTSDENGPGSGNPPSSPNLTGANYYPSSSIEVMEGGNASARWHMGEGSLGARTALDFAKNGDRAGLDVYGERTLETRYVFQARVGVWQWNDNLRADRDATSLQYVLGAGYRILPRSLALVDFEHDMNRIAGQRFRVMAWLNFAVPSR